LVVPSPVVDFVNLPEDVSEDVPFDVTESTSGCSTVARSAESETEVDVWESESPSEDSVVGSPESLQTPGLLTPIGEEEELDLVMFTSPPQDSDLSFVESDELLLENRSQEVEIYCDEDDDLPPLDGWYQDIAARSGYIFSA
jgi:hypothetical protein